MLGYAITGSFCTHERSLEAMLSLKEQGFDILPVVSERAAMLDTRFGSALDLREKLQSITGNTIIDSICTAELLGPKISLDALIIAPCTGNTLAKLAHGITDTTVCMAAKAHLRRNRPLLIALASNDALSANLANIATLLNRKNIYFVPMRQDEPDTKPHSLIADFSIIPHSLSAMLEGQQLRPLFL